MAVQTVRDRKAKMFGCKLQLKDLDETCRFLLPSIGNIVSAYNNQANVRIIHKTQTKHIPLTKASNTRFGIGLWNKSYDVKVLLVYSEFAECIYKSVV